MSADKCGWDITASQRERERHVEIQGVSGTEPTLLLTRNELASAQSDPDWCLTVIAFPEARSKRELLEYDAAVAVATAEGYVYRLELS